MPDRRRRPVHRRGPRLARGPHQLRRGLAEALAGVELEIRRAYDWLDEQLALWKQAVRDCEEEVVRAKAELSQRKFRPGTAASRTAPCRRRASGWRRARLEHAEEQVAKVPAVDRPAAEADRRGCTAARPGGWRTSSRTTCRRGRPDLARRVASLEVYAGLRPDFASRASAWRRQLRHGTDVRLPSPRPGKAVREETEMRFGTTRSQIYDAQKTARAKWDATADEWDDAVRRDHGENDRRRLDESVSEVLRAIDQLTTLFVQIRQECEFPGNVSHTRRLQDTRRNARELLRPATSGSRSADRRGPRAGRGRGRTGRRRYEAAAERAEREVARARSRTPPRDRANSAASTRPTARSAGAIERKYDAEQYATDARDDAASRPSKSSRPPSSAAGPSTYDRLWHVDSHAGGRREGREGTARIAAAQGGRRDRAHRRALGRGRAGTGPRPRQTRADVEFTGELPATDDDDPITRMNKSLQACRDRGRPARAAVLARSGAARPGIVLCVLVAAGLGAAAAFPFLVSAPRS